MKNRIKLGKRIVTFLAAFTLLLTSVNLPENVMKAEAAGDTYVFTGVVDSSNPIWMDYEITKNGSAYSDWRIYGKKGDTIILKNNYDTSSIGGDSSRVYLSVNSTEKCTLYYGQSYTFSLDACYAITCGANPRIDSIYAVSSYVHTNSNWNSSYVEYTSNGVTNHTVKCKYCTYSATEDHTDTDSNGVCDACGQALSFNVTFNYGGNGTADTTATYSPNSTYGTLPTPTWTGHHFLGWYKTSSGGTAVSSTDSAGTSAHTLYAQWELNTFTVNYDANGGSSAPGSTTVTYGTAASLSSTAALYPGHGFRGWATANDAANPQYQAGDSIFTGSGSINIGSGYDMDSDGNNGGSTTVYAVWHEHNWNYSADNNKLTATCDVLDCTVTNSKAEIELKAKESLSYTGVAADKADIFSDTSFTEFNTATDSSLSAADIKIYKADSSGSKTGTEDLTGTILDVGHYVAELSVGSATASTTFEVKKAESSIGTAPTVISGLIYNGSSQDLINAGTGITGGEINYSLTGIETDYSADIPAAQNAGTYTVYYKVIGDSNHSDTEAQTITVTISKADQTISAPTAESADIYPTHVKLNDNAAGNGNTEYAVSTSDSAPSEGWQGDTEFTGLEYNTQYYFFARYVGNDNYNPVTSTSLDLVTPDLADGVLTGITLKPGIVEPGITYTGLPVLITDIYSGTPTIDNIVRTKYEWFEMPSGTSLPSAPTDPGNYKLKISVMSDTNIGTEEIEFTIIKADQTPIDKTTLTSGADTGSGNGTINGVTEDYEYSVDGGENWIACPDGKITGLSAGTVKIRKKETTGYNASDSIDVIVEAGQEAPVVTISDATRPYDGGPYYAPSTASEGSEVFSFDYDEDKPGKGTITFDPDIYEVFEKTYDKKALTGQTSENGTTITIDTGKKYYIRKKATDTKIASEFTEFVIPKLDSYTVVIGTSSGSTGSVAFGGSAGGTGANKVIYTGQTVELDATAKPGYTFTKWVNKADGSTYSTDNPLSLTVTDSSLSLTAVFEASGDSVVAVPELFLKSTTFIYDGTEKICFDEADLPEGVTLTGDNRATDAGTYKFTLTLPAGKKWSDGTTAPKTYRYTILKKDSTDTSTSSDYEYDPVNKRIERKTAPLTMEGYEIKFEPDGEPVEITEEYYDIPQHEDGTIQEGTYYIRKAATDNEYPGAWVPVQVGTPGIKSVQIEKTAPSEITDKTAKLNIKCSDVTEVTTQTLKYRKKGSKNWTVKVISPVTDDIQIEITGLTPETEYEYCLEIGDGTETKTSDIWTLKTQKSTPTGNITCTVENELGSDTTAIVTIEQGNMAIATQEISVDDGSAASAGPFKGLKDGVYNIVVRANDGDFVETRSITILNGGAESVDFIIKKGKLSTLVKIEENAPDAAVDGLKEIIAADETDTEVQTGKKNVDVTLSVAKKNSASLETEEKKSMQSLVKSGTTISNLLEMNLTKTTTSLNVSGEITGIATEDIGASNTNVLEVAVPVSKAVKNLLRIHNGIAESFTSLSERPEGSYMDGTYYTDGKYVYIYASGFSTFAIVTKAASNSSDDSTTTTVTEESTTPEVTENTVTTDKPKQVVSNTSSDRNDDTSSDKTADTDTETVTEDKQDGGDATEVTEKSSDDNSNSDATITDTNSGSTDTEESDAASSVADQNSNGSTSGHSAGTVVAIIAAACVAVFFIFFLLIWKRRKDKDEDEEQK